ncbi:extracellular superoxide dismutase [Cu-Zn] isoform X2 [Pipistrellus kuhlii]|uniref:extracellular superoxide dismutase [Cu-Zn] isoform X2 n=1 Tax=Pipistrellus kuhlii TaxID=59472 RepID=UPI00174F6C69|nr:extracellular superoxide dismutase [Cu-Zn] isoform X2 [Pipistrellus kuhlii]
MTFFPQGDHSPGLAFRHTHRQPGPRPGSQLAFQGPDRLQLRVQGAALHSSAGETLLEGLARCQRSPAMLALLCACCFLVACASGFGGPEQPNGDPESREELARRRAASTLYAACEVRPSASLDAAEPRVTGLVLFRQLAPGGRLDAYFDLKGFPTEPYNSSRAIHVHQFGDTMRGCEATGPHYNPLGVLHPQHPGDFGNFVVRGGGLWRYRAGLAASLSGPHSIVGRAVVVHAGEDDLGLGSNAASLQNGNAGRRLACCVVGLCGPEHWARLEQEHQQRKERKKRRRESKAA